MSTGIESWNATMTDIGPLYPFVGSEGFWLIVCMALWIIWHIVQTRLENKTYEEEVRRYGDPDTLRNLVKHEDPENP